VWPLLELSGMSRGKKSKMTTIGSYEKMALAPDLPEVVRTSLALIEERLLAILAQQRETEAQRNEIRAIAPDRITAAEIDKMRKLSHAMMDLLRKERSVRGRELAAWFSALPVFVRELSVTLDQKAEEARESVRKALLDMGYEKVLPAMIAGHPDVRKLAERLERIGRLVMILGNADSPAMNYPPRLANVNRCEELDAILQEAVKRSGSPIEAAALV